MNLHNLYNEKKYVRLLIRFTISFILVYIIWIPFASIYGWLILEGTTLYFNYIAGVEGHFDTTPSVLFLQGIQSNVPPFVALVLTTETSLKKSFKIALLGIPILFVYQVISKIVQVYMEFPNTSEMYIIFVNFVSGTGNVALPIILWLIFYMKISHPKSKD